MRLGKQLHTPVPGTLPGQTAGRGQGRAARPPTDLQRRPRGPAADLRGRGQACPTSSGRSQLQCEHQSRAGRAKPKGATSQQGREREYMTSGPASGGPSGPRPVQADLVPLSCSAGGGGARAGEIRTTSLQGTPPFTAGAPGSREPRGWSTDARAGLLGPMLVLRLPTERPWASHLTSLESSFPV